jgi:hypothetical protein
MTEQPKRPSVCPSNPPFGTTDRSPSHDSGISPQPQEELEMKSIDSRTMTMMLAGAFVFSALALSRPDRSEAGAPEPGPAPTSQAPQRPPALEKMMRFVGSWDAQATLVLDGALHHVPYHADFQEIADGSGLYGTESFTDADLGTLLGSNLVGFDPFDGKIHWYSVDNMGTTHEHHGDWESADHFHMEHHGLREGKPFAEIVDMTFKGPDELDFRLTATLDGKEVERGEGLFHRRAAMAGRAAGN